MRTLEDHDHLDFRVPHRHRESAVTLSPSEIDAKRNTWHESRLGFEEQIGGYVRVAISHNLDMKRLMIGPALARWVAGRFFIQDIAAKTLAGVKRKVEAQEYLRAIPLR